MQNRSYLEYALESAIKNKEGKTAVNLIQLIKSHPEAKLTARNADGKSFLHLAFEYKIEEVIDELFALQQNDMDMLFGVDNVEASILFRAVENGMFDWIKKLINIAKSQARGQIGHKIWLNLNKYGLSYLHAAAFGKQPVILDYLLELIKDDPASIDFINSPVSAALKHIPQGSSALHIACQKNECEIAEMLIRHRALIDVVDDFNRTPLEVIPEDKLTGFLTFLAKRGALIGKTVPKKIADKLIDIAQHEDILLVGTLVDGKPIDVRENCVKPRLAVAIVDKEHIDLVTQHCNKHLETQSASDAVKIFYYLALGIHVNLRTLAAKKIEFDQNVPLVDITKNEIDHLPARYSKRVKEAIEANEHSPSDVKDIEEITHEAEHTKSSLENVILLNEDKKKLTDLIKMLNDLINDLQATTQTSTRYKILAIAIPVIYVLAYIGIEIFLGIKSMRDNEYYRQVQDLWYMCENPWRKDIDCSDIGKKLGHADQARLSSHHASIYFGIFGFLSVFGLPFLTAMLWLREKNINRHKWQDILNAATNDALEKLQHLEQKERDDNINNPAPVSYLPIPSYQIGELESHINALTTNLPIRQAITALRNLLSDLQNLRVGINKTHKPISLFWKPAAQDAIINIPDSDENMEEEPLLRKASR